MADIVYRVPRPARSPRGSFRSRRKDRAPTGKLAAARRLVLGLAVCFGLLYSLYSLFVSGDVYVDLQEMISMDRFQEVDELTRTIHRLYPLDIRMLRLMGRNYFLHAMRIDHSRDDQTEEGWELYRNAVDALKKAIELDDLRSGTDSRDYYIIGYSYLKRGDDSFEDALRFLLEAEERNGKDRALTEAKERFFQVRTLTELIGYLHYRMGRYEEALAYYIKANNPKQVLNYLYIARCLKNLNRYDEAIETFRLVYDYANTRKLKEISLHNLGWIYYQLERFDEAAMAYRDSVSMDTNYAEGYYWLGKIEERNGRVAQAQALWKRSLEADPHFGPAILKTKYFVKK
jgi:tetratricopeptide (TPR) repeat protein